VSWRDYEAELIRITDAVLDDDQPPDDTLRCPRCGGALHVKLSIYTRGPRQMLGLMAWCGACGPAIARDFDGSRIPKWLES
jgi:hypothetical protein